MKRILFAASALAIAGAAALTPANAQVNLGADAGGVGVQVGPIGAGIGPYWDGRYHHRYWRDYAYAPGDCRLILERIVTPGGDVIANVTGPGANAAPGFLFSDGPNI